MLRVVSENRVNLCQLMMLTGGEGDSGDAGERFRRADASSLAAAMSRSMEE
jgi:hypothetical protein